MLRALNDAKSAFSAFTFRRVRFVGLASLLPLRTCALYTNARVEPTPC